MPNTIPVVVSEHCPPGEAFLIAYDETRPEDEWDWWDIIAGVSVRKPEVAFRLTGMDAR